MPVSHFTMTLGRQATIDQRGISTANTTAGWWCLKKKQKKTRGSAASPNAIIWVLSF